jgi:hypothetical protein
MKLNNKSQLGLGLSVIMVTRILEHHYNNFIQKSEFSEEEKQKAVILISLLFLKEITKGPEMFNNDVSVKELCKIADNPNTTLQQRTELLNRINIDIGKMEEFSRVCGKYKEAIQNLSNTKIKETFYSTDLALKEKNYILSENALELAKRIKIDEDKFDVRFLSKVADKKIMFLLGKNLFIRFLKTVDTIVAVRVEKELRNGDEYVNYSSFKIDTKSGVISYNDRPDSPLSDDKFKLFLQLLIFTELSELQTVFIKPGHKIGTKKEGRFLNETKDNIILVDSTWNRTIIRTEGFSVRGHFRLQPCGVGLIDRKLIYVDEFQKNGYIRGAKKEQVEQLEEIF